MKKLFKTMLFASIGILTIGSCTNEDIMDVIPQVKSQEMDKTLSKEIFKFKYHGIQYAAEYEVADSTMIFTDPEISDIICNLESDPLVATLTYPDGMVEYFDSNSDLEEKIEMGDISDESINSRVVLPPLVSLTLRVYEDADFKGDMLTFDGPFECPYFIPRPPYVSVGKTWDNIISSFQLIGGVLPLPLLSYPTIKIYNRAIVTFYEDEYYAYGSASFLIDRANPQISHSNFKKVKRCPSCKYNMNDRTSSIKLYWLD